MIEDWPPESSTVSECEFCYERKPCQLHNDPHHTSAFEEHHVFMMCRDCYYTRLNDEQGCKQ